MRYVDNVTFKYCLEQEGKSDEFFFTVRGVKGYIGAEKPKDGFKVFVWDEREAKWNYFEIIKDFKPVKKKEKKPKSEKKLSLDMINDIEKAINEKDLMFGT